MTVVINSLQCWKKYCNHKPTYSPKKNGFIPPSLSRHLYYCPKRPKRPAYRTTTSKLIGDLGQALKKKFVLWPNEPAKNWGSEVEIFLPEPENAGTIWRLDVGRCLVIHFMNFFYFFVPSYEWSQKTEREDVATRTCLSRTYMVRMISSYATSHHIKLKCILTDSLHVGDPPNKTQHEGVSGPLIDQQEDWRTWSGSTTTCLETTNRPAKMDQRLIYWTFMYK